MINRSKWQDGYLCRVYLDEYSNYLYDKAVEADIMYEKNWNIFKPLDAYPGQEK